MNSKAEIGVQIPVYNFKKTTAEGGQWEI